MIRLLSSLMHYANIITLLLLLKNVIDTVQSGGNLNRCTDTSNLRHFGPKTFRHWCRHCTGRITLRITNKITPETHSTTVNIRDISAHFSDIFNTNFFSVRFKLMITV